VSPPVNTADIGRSDKQLTAHSGTATAGGMQNTRPSVRAAKLAVSLAERKLLHNALLVQYTSRRASN